MAASVELANFGSGLKGVYGANNVSISDSTTCGGGYEFRTNGFELILIFINVKSDFNPWRGGFILVIVVNKNSSATYQSRII